MVHQGYQSLNYNKALYEKFKGKAEALKSQGHKGLIDRIIAKKYGTTEEGALKQ